MMSKSRVIQIFEELFTLSSIKLIELVEQSNYPLDEIEKYFIEEKNDIEKSAEETARTFADDLFIGHPTEAKFESFIEKFNSLRLHWIFVPHQICRQIVKGAGVGLKHCSTKETNREIERLKELHKKARDMKQKQDIEDAKNEAADAAVNKLIQGGDFQKILNDIQNAANNQKQDKFNQKYALICCNENYKTKAGLDNLPQTKNDLEDIRRTVKMLGISDVKELVDATA